MQIGQKALITCDNWFFGPDGHSYRAVWGTIRGVHTSEQTLGVKTNAKSTNWYVEIGNTVVAGCQIHYAVECPNPPNFDDITDADGKKCRTNIFNADALQ